MAAASEYPGKLVSAASIANLFQADITDAIKKRKDAGKAVPKLIGILATPSPPSVAYAEWTKKACEQVGIEFEIWKTWYEKAPGGDDNDDRSNSEMMEGIEGQRPDTDLEADVEDLIIAANADDNIHGIMVYYPIFGGRQDTYLQQILDPRKDVEGLHFSYCWNMYHNVRWILPNQLGGAPGTMTEANEQVMDSEMEERIPIGFAKSILPCTPLAVVKCLESMGVYDRILPFGDRLYGKVITVINRSEVVGRPLAALLSNDGAKVFSIDLESIQEFNKRATIEKDRRPSEAVTRAREKNSQRRLRSHHIVRPCSLTMQQCIEASDVVISGVPSSNFKIQTDWIKCGAITVNFSSEKNFEKDVRRRASKHLPAIGKTTIAMLQRNLLRLVEYKEMGSNYKGVDHYIGNGGDDDNHGGGGGGGGRGGGRNDTHNGVADKSDRLSGPSQISSTSQSNHTSASTTRDPSSSGNRQNQHMLKCAADDTALFISPNKSTRSGLGAAFTYRNRSNTVTLPPTSVDRVNIRTVSHPLCLQHSEWVYPHDRSSIASSASTSTLWDWRHGDDSRRASVISGVTTIASTESPSPGNTKPKSHTITLPSLSQTSPLMFGPASPFGANTSTSSSSRGSIYPLSLLEKANSISSPRLATPISPLLIDQLSVDDYPQSISASMHWDNNAPRTPRDAHLVIERPIKDMPQRLYQPFVYPTEADRSIITTTSSPRRESITSNAPDRITQNRRRRRPPFSYSSLIAQAISSSPEGRMTLREIYTWISKAYPDLYSMDGNEGSGWQNTVRHNLSLNKCFVKVARTAKDIYESCSSGLPSQSQAARGKGGWWTLDHTVAQAQLGNFYRGDSLGSSESTGGNTPIAASYVGNENSRGKFPSIPSPSPSVIQLSNSTNSDYSPGFAIPRVQSKQGDQYGRLDSLYASPMTPSKYGSYDSSGASNSSRSTNEVPLFHLPQRKLSMSERNETRRRLPLISARRSSVSSNQHSTIKRKLPFATPSHRHGSNTDEIMNQYDNYDEDHSHSSNLLPLTLQRPQVHPQQIQVSYQQKNQRQDIQDTHRIINTQQQHHHHHHSHGSTLYTQLASIPLVSSSSQRSTAMKVDDDTTASKDTPQSDSAKSSARLAINDLLNS